MKKKNGHLHPREKVGCCSTPIRFAVLSVGVLYSEDDPLAFFLELLLLPLRSDLIYGT